MRGKSKIKKKKLQPDRKYNSLLITEFINNILMMGKRDKAEKIVYNAFDIIKNKLKKPPLEIFKTAIRLASPQVEVKSKRIGGATYQVPVEVSTERKIDLVFRWLTKIAKTRKGKKMEEKIAFEILSMYKNEGAVIKKRDDVHRMAEANKAFAHFARF